MAQLLGNPKARFLDEDGNPYVGGKVYTYVETSTTPLATYTSPLELPQYANTNPVILDARGEADIWLKDGYFYKIVLKDADDNSIWTVNNIASVNNGSINSSMLATDSVTENSIEAGAVTFNKLAAGTLGNVTVVTKTADYTITALDEVVIVNAISNDVIISYPSVASSNNKKVRVIRSDDNEIQTDTFVDGDVTLGTENINSSSHPFYNAQRVQLTTSGVLPTGLSLATNYYIIYVDANNVKLASSKANALIGTAVNISAASGGGTHTITSQKNTVTVDGYLSNTINGATSFNLPSRYDFIECVCNGVEWFIAASNIFTQINVTDKTYIGAQSSEIYFKEESGSDLGIYIEGAKVAEFDETGLASGISNGFITKPMLAAANYSISSSSGTFSSSAAGPTNVTNLSVSITTSGRPVFMALIPDGTNNFCQFSTDGVAALRFVRGSTTIGYLNINDSSDAQDFPWTPNTFIIDAPAAGTYTYKMQSTTTLGSIAVNYIKLLVMEL